jgi:hypothetical protein
MHEIDGFAGSEKDSKISKGSFFEAASAGLLKKIIVCDIRSDIRADETLKPE